MVQCCFPHYLKSVAAFLLLHPLILGSLFCHTLSKDVQPTHYVIKLRPDIDNGNFSGETWIYIRLLTPQSSILINSAKLNIDKVQVNGTVMTDFTVDAINETLCINSNLPPTHDHLLLYIKYTGSLHHNGFGLIRETYNTSSGPRYLIASEFETNHARKAFPCFDEPTIKATFNITLIAPNATYTALSNMNEIGRNFTDNGVVYDFATSVPMSTYLVSFAITDQTFAQIFMNDTGRIIPIRIYTFNASMDENKFQLNTAMEALQYYTNYTNIRYPLPKLDLIEYNRTSTSLATENWGLITFRQGILSHSGQLYPNSIIAFTLYHELSHFWFGNLVTNAWWNDLWLQEGFATYFSYKSLSDGQIMQNSGFYWDWINLFSTDCKCKSNSVVSEAETKKQIEEKFSSLVYEKGAAVIYMIEHSLGPVEFRRIIQIFLTKFSYKSATTDDFLAVIDSVVPNNQHIRSFIRSYLYQKSYPVLNVQESPEGSTFVLTQLSCDKCEADLNRKWTIPVSYLTNMAAESQLVWYNEDMDNLTITVPGAKWIKFNSQEIGMYLVVYTENMLNNIMQHSKDIEPQEYNYLISHSTILYELGYANCDVALKLINSTAAPIWTYLMRLHIILRDDLLCFQTEWKIYLKFINGILKRNQRNELSFVPGCDDANNRTKNPKILKCAKWISENLQGNCI